jgi:hypothetical protein
MAEVTVAVSFDVPPFTMMKSQGPGANTPGLSDGVERFTHPREGTLRFHVKLETGPKGGGHPGRGTCPISHQMSPHDACDASIHSENGPLTLIEPDSTPAFVMLNEMTATVAAQYQLPPESLLPLDPRTNVVERTHQDEIGPSDQFDPVRAST